MDFFSSLGVVFLGDHSLRDSVFANSGPIAVHPQSVQFKFHCFLLLLVRQRLHEEGSSSSVSRENKTEESFFSIWSKGVRAGGFLGQRCVALVTSRVDQRAR